MEREIFYIHRVIYDKQFYKEEAFLCESVDGGNEPSTVYVNKSSGKIFNSLKAKVEKAKLDILYFPIPLQAAGSTLSEFDFVPGPSYTKRAIDVEITGDSAPEIQALNID
jgi:hypothetical protein